MNNYRLVWRMGYLVYNDYLTAVQDINFQQIIAANDSLRLQKENQAQTEMISYLVQKYDTQEEFKPTTIFAYATTYKGAGSLVQLNFPAYNPAATYALNALTTNSGKEYYCTTAITSPEAFNPSHWQLIGNQYDLWYVDFPYDEFEVTSVYAIGDRVYWKGKIYQCKQPSIIPDHTAKLQAGTYNNIPPINIFPDDKINGPAAWGIGTPYSFAQIIPGAPAPADWSAGFYALYALATYQGRQWQVIAPSGTDTTPGDDIISWQPVNWIAGDNRNAQLVGYMVDMVLFYLRKRLSPRNIPESSKEAYRAAIHWLEFAKDGEVIADIPELQPSQGARIQWGSQVKNINGY